MANHRIRLVTREDCPRVLDVYAPYITDSTTSFEYEVPTLSAFTDRVMEIRSFYPYLVFEENGVVEGFAYASQFRVRAAYRYDVEASIYLSTASSGRRVGTALYTALFRLLSAMNIINVYIGITLPNEASTRLHASFGFSPIGTYRKTGYKMGQWLDVAWYEKTLGSHSASPPAVVPVDGLDRAFVEKTFRECEALVRT
ncbi:N-acetyltransferase family protein [Oscillospiraceae bacterium OttesenSCG-928-G22]|nr:N-acetyltransferase family protein [Oscillospiraceae bacterium OttesenSCG-928-G22]